MGRRSFVVMVDALALALGCQVQQERENGDAVEISDTSAADAVDTANGDAVSPDIADAQGEHAASSDGGADASDGQVLPLDAATESAPRDAVDSVAEAATPDPHACSDLFDPNRVRTYEVQISEAEWNALYQEFINPVPDPDGNGYAHPYHPVVFTMDGETRSDARLRLKGDSSWQDTILEDRPNPKAQFVIAFDQVNNSALFHGVSKLALDMPNTDPTYLRERLGQHMMRELGLPGLCAASARLVINGAYYGLYAAEEKLGKRVLKRMFPEAPGGALWEQGIKLETSATPEQTARQQAWASAEDVPAMLPIIDMDQALREWAGEIALNDADGYYGGDHNFFIYDHPQRGLLWLPNDLDSCFDFRPWTTHPIYWWEDHDTEQTAGQHYRAVINDVAWRARLVDAVDSVISQIDVASVESLIQTWSAQVATAIESDPHRIASLQDVQNATAAMRGSVRNRVQHLQGWIACERTNVGDDLDGDGHPWCKDCDDRNAGIHVGAQEVCGNGTDDNCNGLKDEVCQ